MDAAELNELIHKKNNHYKIKVGEEFTIDLPRIPLTGETEFLQLKTESDDSDCVEEFDSTEFTEGNLAPSVIRGKGLKVGQKHYTVKLINVLDSKQIEDVEPLRIVLEVGK